MQQLLGPVGRPPADVGYEKVLRGPGWSPLRAIFGALMALSLYLIVATLVQQLLLQLFARIEAPGLSLAEYRTRAMAYQNVGGLVATHAALASMILVGMAMVGLWHRRPIGFLASVRPGLRWRFLLVCLVPGLVVANAMFWGPVLFGPQAHLQVPHDWWIWLLPVLLLTPLQAAGEEVLFRGYLSQALGSLATVRWPAVVFPALVFALLHGTQNLWLFLDRFGFGLVAGVLVLLTGGLEASIAAHVANNLCAFGYAIFFGSVAQAHALQEITPLKALADVAGFALIGLACWWLGRRMGIATRTASEPQPSVVGGRQGLPGQGRKRRHRR